MSTIAPTEKPTFDLALVPAELKQAVESTALAVETRNTLRDSFAPHFIRFVELAEAAKLIAVNDPDGAREMRLKLKGVRVASEKARKALKDEVLVYGKAIDGINNLLESKITPIEERLDAIEKAEAIAAAERKAALKVKREADLKPYGINTEFYPLGEMDDATFDGLLANTKLAHETRAEQARKAEEERKAAEAKAEAERVAAAAKAEADRVEAARIAAENAEKQRLENERLKKEAEEREAAAKVERERVEAERVAAKKKADEAAAKAAAELAETKRKADEAAAAAAEVARKERQAAELKAAAERAEIQRKADEAAKAAAKARAAAEAKAAAERAAREKLEADIAAAKAAQAQREEEEAEAARKAAAAPDKEKLHAMLAQFSAIQIPEMATPAGQEAASAISKQHARFIEWVQAKINTL